MSAAQRCADAIRRIGVRAALYRDGERAVEFFASLQPAGAPGEAFTAPTGCGARNTWVLFAPASPALLPADAVECLGRRYHVTGVRPMIFGGETAYQKAYVREGD